MSFDLFINCIKLWWDPSYSTWMYFALFLPVVIIVYSCVKKEKRYIALFILSELFLFTVSGLLTLIHILETIWTWKTALIMDRINKDSGIKRKSRNEKKKRVLTIGIVSLILVLYLLKYLDFTGMSLERLFGAFYMGFTWTPLNLAFPLGLSYFTLEAISYLTDVYRENTEAEGDYIKVALYMGFFPKLAEGPITRFNEVSATLFSGSPVTYENLTYGYQRILLGLFKKLMIADHLAPAVDIVFEWQEKAGSVALFGAIIFTIQEYMDFSGIIDIAIGSARIFGVVLSENFRQPFFAKNASDFWHRWHITLGTFFRDYIFYPVSVNKGVMKFTKKVKEVFGSNVSRFAAPTVAIFCVWISNGIWHGPKWTYIFYGLYYFFWIFIENILEKPFLSLLSALKLTEESFPVKAFRSVKLFFIVIFGEMFFRAETLRTGFEMFRMIFTDFNYFELEKHIGDFGMHFHDYVTVTVAFLLIMAFNILKEYNFPIRNRFMALPLPLRWGIWYIIMMSIVIFGAYGSGYDAAGMMYAKF